MAIPVSSATTPPLANTASFKSYDGKCTIQSTNATMPNPKDKSKEILKYCTLIQHPKLYVVTMLKTENINKKHATRLCDCMCPWSKEPRKYKTVADVTPANRVETML
jgi:hypothetical protein